MKKATLSVLAAILSLTAQNASASFYNYYDPRLSLWGLAGTPEQARGDFLFPLAGNVCNLFYADMQGSYTRPSNAWNSNNRSRDADYVSAGAGFRKLYESSVLGAYLFYDRDESRLHNIYNVISPGVEGFFCNWDARINGYFPVNQRKTLKSFSSQFPCDCADCVDCVQCESAVFFQGHKQFGHQFTILEQAGRGGDAEIGYTFHRLNSTQLHGGVYYFNFNTPNHSWILHDNSSNNLVGVEGRLEAPVNRMWSLTVEASYDRLQRGALVGGLRFNPLPAKYCPTDLRSHMTDAIPRNLGTLKTGSGVPTITAKHDEGIFLQRDNIYFFSATGGSAFVDRNSGTFENPLSNDQFSQAVVDAIGPSANYYIPTGTYLIQGTNAPNASITLQPGDAIFGRNTGWLTAARGADRPILLGSMTLPGFNTLASIQLINSATSTGTTNLSLITLNIQNAPGIVLCNDKINATASVNGDLSSGIVNAASGIYANNSNVLMKQTTVEGLATVSGSNFGLNAATGIGGITLEDTVNTENNQFTILDSSISGTARVGADNNGISFFQPAANLASGIGGSTIFGSTSFNKNHFIISNSNVSGLAQVSGKNMTQFSANYASGIGGNRSSLFIPGDSDFNSNQFDISNNSNVTGTAHTGSDNIGSNYAVGFGGNVGAFNHNIINISDSKVSASALVSGNALPPEPSFGSANFATGIGSNADSFVDNTIDIKSSQILAHAEIVGDQNFSSNYAAGIGNNGVGGGADFISNIINVENATTITATAMVDKNNINFSENFVTGIGNNFSFAGLDVFNGNTINITNSTINATATVILDNLDNLSPATNDATGVKMNNTGTNNTVNINQIISNVLAQVHGNNSATNTATGLFANPGDVINISNSTVNITALINGINTGTNSAVKTAGGGTFNVFNTQFIRVQNP